MPVILYEKQRQILDFIAQYIQRNGYAPCLKDIAQGMGLSSLATVHEHIKQLSGKGVVRVHGKGKTRTLEIVDKKMANMDKGVKLPILGFFSEGSKIEPYTVPHAFYGVAPSMITGKRRAFILQVKDDLLAGDGILANDFLILEEEPLDFKNNEPVVVLDENNNALLKRLFKESTRVKLEALKADKAPLFYPKVKVQGRLIGIIRTY